MDQGSRKIRFGSPVVGQKCRDEDEGKQGPCNEGEICRNGICQPEEGKVERKLRKKPVLKTRQEREAAQQREWAHREKESERQKRDQFWEKVHEARQREQLWEKVHEASHLAQREQQERMAAEKVEQERMAAEKAEQERERAQREQQERQEEEEAQEREREQREQKQPAEQGGRVADDFSEKFQYYFWLDQKEIEELKSLAKTRYHMNDSEILNALEKHHPNPKESIIRELLNQFDMESTQTPPQPTTDVSQGKALICLLYTSPSPRD